MKNRRSSDRLAVRAFQTWTECEAGQRSAIELGWTSKVADAPADAALGQAGIRLRVVELPRDKTVIETVNSTVAYRRYNKPALGPLANGLDDFAPAIAANKSDATTTKHHGLPRPDDLSVPEFLRDSNV